MIGLWLGLGGVLLSALVWGVGFRMGSDQGYADGKEEKTILGGMTFLDGYKTGYTLGYLNGREDERKGVPNRVAEE